MDVSEPLEVEVGSTAFARIRAALMHAGAAEALRRLREYEHSVHYVTRVTACRWFGARLMVALVCEPQPGAGWVFRRAADRIYLELPGDVTAGLSGAAAAALVRASDVTDEVGRGRIHVVLRNVEEGEEVSCPATFHTRERPIGADRYTLSFSAEVDIEPATAIGGAALLGTWSASSVIDLCGHRSTAPVNAQGSSLPGPAFVNADGLLVRPYRVDGVEDLRLAGAASDLDALRGLVPVRRAHAQEFAGTLRLDIPLLLGAAPPVTLPLTVLLLPADDGSPLRVPGRIVAPLAPEIGGGVLVADLPAARLTFRASASGRWSIAVAAGDKPTELGAQLVYRVAKDGSTWSITPSWRFVLHRITYRLRTTTRAVRHRLHR